MTETVAGGQLYQAQPVAPEVEAHGLGIDRDRWAEVEPVRQVVVMELVLQASSPRRFGFGRRCARPGMAGRAEVGAFSPGSGHCQDIAGVFRPAELGLSSQRRP